MTNEFFVTGLILLTLIVGAALLPVDALLRPNRREQLWIGLISGLASVLIATLHYRGNTPGVSFVHPSILASVSFLFGPFAGAVAAVCSLLSQLLGMESNWLQGIGLAFAMWAVGSMMWWVRMSTRMNFWTSLVVLVVLVPLVISPWARAGDTSSDTQWHALQVVPWRYVVGMVVLCGGVGLLNSRARTLQMLQLRESELVQALKASGGGRWEWDVAQQQFFYHGNFYRNFGLEDSPDDEDATPLKPLRGKELLSELQSRIHPQDLQRLLPDLKQALEGLTPSFYGELRIRDGLGRWRWLIARGSTVERDANGRTLRMSGMLLDITEHHTMAEALRHSEVKYSTFYETLSDPAGILRVSDGRYIDVNPALARMLNLPAADLVGKTGPEVGVTLSEKDREVFQKRLQLEGHFHGAPASILYNGVAIPGLLSARRTYIMGDSCVVFVYHDMTQAHEIQDRLQASNKLLQQASRLARLGAWEGKPGQGITVWSDVTCEIHGVPVGTPPPRHYIDRFVAPEWRDMVRQTSKLHGALEKTWDMEFEIIRTDGQRLWVRVRSETVVKDGQLIKIRGILQDVDEFRRTSERMHASEARFEHIFQALPVPLCFVRKDDGRFVGVNPAWEKALGYSKKESIGHTLVDLGIYTTQTRSRLVEAAQQAGQLVGYENELRARSGATLTVLQSMSATEVAGQACWLLSVLDITERKAQERKVREREELLSLSISAADIGLWDLDLLTDNIQGDVRWHSMQARPFNWESVSRAEPWQNTIGEEQQRIIERALEKHMHNPSAPFDVTWRVSAPQSPSRWLRNVGKVVRFDTEGRALRMLGVSMDVTMQHEQQELLHHMAHYDALTGLPNRVLLAERLRDALEQTRQSGTHLAVAYIDLDALKAINDELGHELGDRLLVLVAGRLQRALRPGDCVARLSGDEFAVVFGDLTNREACERRLRATMEAVGAPYDLSGVRIDITASVGYTLFPEDSADPDTLLRHADQAMYVAKQAGGNRLRAFDSVQESARQNLMEQLARFDEAMNNGELAIYLQPKVNMRTGVVIGAEALARWVHPENGVMLPGSFLHWIDGTELEAKFAQWVMDSSLAHMAQLKRQGLNMQISINIVAEQLRHRGFADWVLAQLEKYPDVRPDQLDLEITENAALYDVNHVAKELTQLRARGVSVSLDDFGTGYSSLAYLRRLPIDQLKLDQSYVRGMVQDAADQAIVQGVIGLARSFGYRIVAEGVETQEQGDLLVRMGCHIAQGHGISKPMPAEDFANWAAHWQAPASWLDSSRRLSAEAIPLV